MRFCATCMLFYIIELCQWETVWKQRHFYPPCAYDGFRKILLCLCQRVRLSLGILLSHNNCSDSFSLTTTLGRYLLHFQSGFPFTNSLSLDRTFPSPARCTWSGWWKDVAPGGWLCRGFACPKRGEGEGEWTTPWHVHAHSSILPAKRTASVSKVPISWLLDSSRYILDICLLTHQATLA